MKYNQGFTLIELLISILILSMISIASYYLFNSIIKTQESTTKSLNDLDELQLIITILEKDLSQIAPKKIYSQYNHVSDAIAAPQNNYLIEFSKFGWKNPFKQKRSNIQRVSYHLKNNKLIRTYWSIPQRINNEPGQKQIVSSNIKKIKFQFLSKKKKWYDFWPQKNDNTHPNKNTDNESIPQAILISITHMTFENIKKTIVLYDSNTMDQIEEKNSPAPNEKHKH